MTITHGYWKVRGLGQPIRYLLAHVGAEFEDVQYEIDMQHNNWHHRDKLVSPLDFPNIPYLYDGDVRISQSIAILRYLGRKYGLDGQTESEKIRIDMTEQQVQDFSSSVTKMYYAPATTNETMDEFRRTTAMDNLSALSKFLGEREFFSGAGISYADFKAYEYVYMMSLFAPDAVKEHSNLVNFLKRIESLPGVAAFIASDRHIKWPFSAPFAKWGNSNSNPELAP